MDKESPESMFREKIVIKTSSKEEAVEIVKEFWQAMPHGVDLTKPSNENDEIDWTQELTMGDRTKISRGLLPNEKNKWLVQISGNHQPLSPQATEWLMKKGYFA